MNTAVKERPILFSTEMVRAILEGRKTVTRRVIKESWNGCLTNGGPHPCPNDPVVFYPGESFEVDGETVVVDYPEVRALFHCSTLDSEAKCPFGKPGDHLWVRETFTILDYWGDSKAVYVMYEGGATAVCTLTDREWDKFIKWQDIPDRKSSLFMFRSLSRLKLLIKSISVERLQDITEEDAIREGVYLKAEDINGGICYLETAVEAFRTLWQSINGADSWDANPWVWRIEFSRIKN